MWTPFNTNKYNPSWAQLGKDLEGIKPPKSLRGCGIIAPLRGGLVTAQYLMYRYQAGPLVLAHKGYNENYCLTRPVMPNSEVIIADDVLDSGKTIAELDKTVQNQGWWISGIYVIHNKLGVNVFRGIPVYWGKSVAKSKWIRYPWDE